MNRRHFLGSLAAGIAGHTVLLPRDLHAANIRGWVELSRPMMGTFASVAVFGDRVQALPLIDQCLSYMQRCADEISCWSPDSQTAALCSEKNLGRGAISPNLTALLRTSESIAKLTGGRFNPLTWQLSELWRSARMNHAVPAPREIASTLKLCLDSSIVFSADRIALKGDARLDFGGITPGLIADLAVKYLVERGVTFARIDCGGETAFLGNASWQTAIRHPRKNAALGAVLMRGSGALATSGDYEQSAVVNGKRNHHLLDMTTGHPARACQSVTITAPCSMQADALATALFSLEARESLALIKRLPGVEALIVDAAGGIHKTAGLHFSV